MKIESLVILVAGAFLLYRFILWLMQAKRTPDPWGVAIEQALARPDAVPLCHRCLAPQEHNGWFCPECGSIVGHYGNYLPSIYIYSIGEAARAGVEQPNRWTPLLVTGYALIALGYFSVLAPFYCLFLFRNRAQHRLAPHA
ncbi:MAG TPA: hypothetical protein VNZ22_07850 [Bacillota bacterium]|nr:hypothetical protein [Bacillota bacterium]